jgi:hypothetical protein
MKSNYLRSVLNISDRFKKDIAVLGSLSEKQLEEIASWLENREQINTFTRIGKQNLEKLCTNINTTSMVVFSSINAFIFIIKKVIDYDDSVKSILSDFVEIGIIDPQKSETIEKAYCKIESRVKDIYRQDQINSTKFQVINNFRNISYVCDLRLAVEKDYNYSVQKAEAYKPTIIGLSPIVLFNILVGDPGSNEQKTTTFQADENDLDILIEVLNACKIEIEELKRQYIKK